MPVLSPIVAVKPTAISRETRLVVTVKLAVRDPAGIVTVATVELAIDGMSLVMLTVRPPAGATCPSVTVPVDVRPPLTKFGLNVTEVMSGARSVMLAVRLVLLPVAVMVTVVSALTAIVVIGKLAEFSPSGIVSVAGNVMNPAGAALRAIVMPPTGAVSSTVTVPVAGWLPNTVEGLITKPTTPGARTVKVFVLETSGLAAAVIATGVSFATLKVSIVVEAVVLPPAIVTVVS